MNKNIKFIVYILAVSLLLIIFSVCYYFLVSLPRYNSQKIDIEMKNLEVNYQRKAEGTALPNTDNQPKQETLYKETVKTPVAPIQAVEKIDPSVKIEKCKATAKYAADRKAKNDYLQAFEDAQKRGDTETAQVYLEDSFEPKHPADYDSNYQAAYINCLDK